MLKVREAKRLLRLSGYSSRHAKGSHEIWWHPSRGRVTLCGHDGDDLQAYQESRIRRQIAS